MPNKFYYGNDFHSENSIAIVWSIDDVRDQLWILNDNEDLKLTLTDEECMDHLRCILDNHDANYGITWENIYQSLWDDFEEEILLKRKTEEKK